MIRVESIRNNDDIRTLNSRHAGNGGTIRLTKPWGES